MDSIHTLKNIMQLKLKEAVCLIVYLLRNSKLMKKRH